MSVTCQVIIDMLESLAPRYLAENWDNVGLLVGSPAQKVQNVLVTLDVTPEVVDYTIENQIGMIVSHHPFIFKSLNRIRTDMPMGNMLAKLVKADVAVYAAHTNLDSANGGVNDILADKLGLQKVEALDISYTEKLLKLIVFVPKAHADQVREAMTSAGAGYIGKYSHCTFQTEGIGSFKPLEGTAPYIGKQGVVEFVPEYRLETILPEKISRRVINAMLKVHPYEEVAYDLYSVIQPGLQYGLGRVGYLATPITFEEFVDVVKKVLGLKAVQAAGIPDKRIRKVAVCGGSGASLIHKAVFKGADVLVTGDVKYHEAQEAALNDLGIIDAGHFATEQPVVHALGEYLKQCAKENKWNITIMEDGKSANVLKVY